MTDLTAESFDPTLSTLPRAEACPASCVLPRYDNVGGRSRNTLGSAIHRFVELQARDGLREARRDLPRIAEEFALTEAETRVLNARAREFELPVDIARVALVEQPLCLLEDGSVVPVVGGTGKYERPAGAVVAGTLDIVFPRARDGRPVDLLAEDEEPLRCPPGAQLVSVDTKTGSDAHRPPIQRDLQALGSALLAARYTGASEVVQMIWYGGDSWSAPPEALDAADLERIEQRIRSVIGRVREQARLMLDGKFHLMTFTRGPHCQYCPAAVSCPAQTRDLMALARGELVLDKPGPRLPTLEEARQMIPLANAFDSAGKRARALAQQYAEEHGGMLPIEDGDDGRVYARFVEQQEMIRPDVALDALHAVISEAEGGLPVLLVRTGENDVSVHLGAEDALEAIARFVAPEAMPPWVAEQVRAWMDTAPGDAVVSWEEQGLVVEHALDPWLGAVGAMSTGKRALLKALERALPGRDSEAVSQAYRAVLSAIRRGGGFVPVPRPKWRIGHRGALAEQAAADDVSFDEDVEGGG